MIGFIGTRRMALWPPESKYEVPRAHDQSGSGGHRCQEVGGGVDTSGAGEGQDCERVELAEAGAEGTRQEDFEQV